MHRRLLVVAIGCTLLAWGAVRRAEGFEGVRSTEFGLATDPPDLQIGVGPSHIFEITNEKIRISKKSPAGEAVSTSTLEAFIGCPLPFDPRVRYDALGGRWYITACCRTNKVVLAVSAGTDPTGSFTLYDLVLPSGSTAPDFDTLGFSSDKVFVSTDILSPAPGASGHAGWVIKKSDLLAGLPPTIQPLTDFGNFLVFPATTLSASTTLYLVGQVPNTLEVVSIDGLPGVGSGVQVTTQDFPLTRTSMLDSLNIPQKGVPDLLPFLSASKDTVFYNGSLWHAAAFPCIPAGDTTDRHCLRIFQLQLSGSALSLVQNIEYGAVGAYYFLPSFSVDVDGKVVIGFAASSLSMYPSFYATGRTPTDAPGTLRSPSAVAVGQSPFGAPGDPPCPYFSGSNPPPCQRWGDYFGAATDPSNPHVVWLVGQYAVYPAVNWASRIIAVDASGY